MNLTGILSNPRVAALFDKTVTFQKPVSSGTYANYSGLTSLSGRVVTVGKGTKDEDEIWADRLGATHTILLKGHYPTVSSDMRAVIDGNYYDILPDGIRHPASAMTVCAVQRLTATA